MKHIIRVFALVCAVVVIGGPGNAGAQSGTVLSDAVQDWADLKVSILELINFMPPAKFAYKLSLPVPPNGASLGTAQESFGRRVLDIALVNVRFLNTFGAKTKAPLIADTDAMTTKEASMKAVADSFDYGTAVLKEQTEQTMWQKVDASTLGPSSRVRVFRYLYSHVRQIDGELVIYLRLAGEVLPAIAG